MTPLSRRALGTLACWQATGLDYYDGVLEVEVVGGESHHVRLGSLHKGAYSFLSACYTYCCGDDPEHPSKYTLLKRRQTREWLLSHHSSSSIGERQGSPGVAPPAAQRVRSFGTQARNAGSRTASGEGEGDEYYTYDEPARQPLPLSLQSSSSSRPRPPLLQATSSYKGRTESFFFSDDEGFVGALPGVKSELPLARMKTLTGAKPLESPRFAANL